MRRSRRTTSLAVLATLAVVAALYAGAEFLAPVAFAIVLAAILRPLVAALERARVPTTLAAAVVVLGLLAVLVAAGFALVTPVRNWLAAVPERFAAAEAKLSHLRDPVQKLTQVARRVERQATPGTATAPASQPAVPLTPPPTEATVPLLGFVARLLGTTTQVVGALAEVVLLLFLILASGGVFLRKVLRVLLGPDADADDAAREADAVAVRYLGVAAVIFFGQGVVVALVMWLLGMPTPILWGVFTFVFEFVPYLGAAAMIVLLSATALATFDGVGHILLPPLSYLVISTLQANLVSPLTYGRRLRLDPVAVLLSVLFWWFVWGIPGAFLAVPLTAMIKTVSDRTGRLRGVGELLGES
jgi:predicted PurR-regulated permease PerM